MNRYYYISENLDDLERVERELEARGISTEQIHVLSEQNADLAQHDLHSVPSLMKKDLVPFGIRGALIGLILAALALVIPYLTGWTDSPAGWSPFLLLAAILLGFGIWEGGFLGFRRPNRHFRNFAKKLRQGKHLLFVDVEPNQEALLEQVVQSHPQLHWAGTGPAAPHWLVVWLQAWRRFRQMI